MKKVKFENEYFIVILRVCVSMSYLWGKHATESHGGTEADAKAHGYDLVVGAKVNRNKGQPDDARGVHGKGNILGLIKISRNISSLKRKTEKA